jgi:hypothetical protein
MQWVPLEDEAGFEEKQAGASFSRVEPTRQRLLDENFEEGYVLGRWAPQRLFLEG